MKRILLTKEVAQILRVSEEHVRNLIRQKHINAYKEGHRGGFRIPAGEVNKYIKEKQEGFRRKNYKEVRKKN